MQTGALDRLGDGSRPSQEDPARAVRADACCGSSSSAMTTASRTRKAYGSAAPGSKDSRPRRLPDPSRHRSEDCCFFERVPSCAPAIIDNLFPRWLRFPGCRPIGWRRAAASPAWCARHRRDRAGGARLVGISTAGALPSSREAASPSAQRRCRRRGSVLSGARGQRRRKSFRRPARRRPRLRRALIERPGEVALNADNIEMRGDLVLRSATRRRASRPGRARRR